MKFLFSENFELYGNIHSYNVTHTSYIITFLAPAGVGSNILDCMSDGRLA